MRNAPPCSSSIILTTSFFLCTTTLAKHVCPLVGRVRLGELRVKALASTTSRPVPGFVPRRGDGRILGLNIFGISRCGT
jgi:hypothetical protein